MKLHAALIMSCLSCISQTAPAKPPCDPRLTFAPFTPARPRERLPVRQRSARSELLPELCRLRTSCSPDTLTSLWLQPDQNIYKPDSRAKPMGGRRGRRGGADRTNNTMKAE